jgi:hypothetical protein
MESPVACTLCLIGIGGRIYQQWQWQRQCISNGNGKTPAKAAEALFG